MERLPFLLVAGFLILMILVSGVLGYSYWQIWDAHVADAISAADAKAAETRALTTAFLASGGSIVLSALTAIYSAIDRSRVLRGDRAKKATELHTEACHDVYGAIRTGYRLIERAASGQLTQATLDLVTTTFEQSDRKTLGFDTEVVNEYMKFWQASEQFGRKILHKAGTDQAKQRQLWNEGLPSYFANYQLAEKGLKAALKNIA